MGPGHQAARRGRLGARGEQALPDRLRRRPRGGGPVAQGHRLPAGADPQARQEGELLVDGCPRPRRPVFGDPLRPRPQPRPRLHARGARAGHAVQARGPAAGDLEPGLHAGGAQRGPVEGGLRHRRPAAQAEHRHRHGAGAGRVPAAGRRQHVRDRRDVPGDPEGAGAHRPHVRHPSRGRRPVPGGGRPRPQLADADRRRGHPGQRGPRLRAAPADAPGDPLDAAARLRGPGAARAAAGQPRQDGRDLRRPAP